MKGTRLLMIFFAAATLCSCVTSQYSPYKKYPRAALQQDFILLRHILEDKHPSIDWYTSKDSMDSYFDKYMAAIPDSMNESMFAWHILAPVVDKIHCGHTSLSLSRQYARWIRHKRLPSFPLFMKVWNDTMVVTGNLLKGDTVFKRGTLIKAINGQTNAEMISHMFDYLPEDGHANNVNYIRLSSNFPYYHRNIYGLSKNYSVTYIDSLKQRSTVNIAAYNPPVDSTKKTQKIKRAKQPKPSRQQILEQYRSLRTDSSGKFSIMTVGGFTKGRLRKFFRQSFKKLNQDKTANLIIDLRTNGGGRVGLSTLLTKYISRQPFKVADTLYARARGIGKYSRYTKLSWLYNIEMLFVARRQKDGLYHLRHFERKLYKPKTRGYRGNVYVLTGGPTFSAAALFCNAVKGQPAIQLVGEETGGGWYGNSGIVIPDVVLPNTGIRVRLPMFKLVQWKHARVPEKGMGITPDVFVGPSYESVLNGTDRKMQTVKRMILEKPE